MGNDEFIKLARFENDRILKLAKEIVFNANEDFESRFNGLLILMENANNRIQQLQYGYKRLQEVHKSFCDKAILLHKQKRVKEFIERWHDKQVCEQMIEENKQIEKPNHCYKFAGSKVIEEDCNLCTRRCNMDENYHPASFIDLLTEPEQKQTEQTQEEDGTDNI